MDKISDNWDHLRIKRILPCIRIIETTIVEDSEDSKNLKALKNSQIDMTYEGSDRINLCYSRTLLKFFAENPWLQNFR
jgi:hypothetical protein